MLVMGAGVTVGNRQSGDTKRQWGVGRQWGQRDSWGRQWKVSGEGRDNGEEIFKQGLCTGAYGGIQEHLGLEP